MNRRTDRKTDSDRQKVRQRQKVYSVHVYAIECSFFLGLFPLSLGLRSMDLYMGHIKSLAFTMSHPPIRLPALIVFLNPLYTASESATRLLRNVLRGLRASLFYA